MDLPNIVVLVIDCGRPDHFSCYGYHRPTTPFIDNLADEGIVFEKAFTVDTATPLSHFALMSGQKDWGGRAWLGDANVSQKLVFFYRRVLRRLRLTDFVGGYDHQRHSLLNILNSLGYTTVGLSANKLVSPQTLKPFDGFQSFPEEELFQGVEDDPIVADRLKSYKITDNLANRLAVHITADRVLNLAVKTLDQNNPNLARPFFLFMNFMDCHDPYLVHADYKHDFGFIPNSDFNGDLRNRFQNVPNSMERSSRWLFTQDLDSATVDMLRWNYDRCLGYVDSQVGELVKKLKARGAYENTIFFILADHGEHLGEDGRFAHSMGPSELQLHIPLIVSGANHVPGGERVSRQVNIVDVRPTIFDLLNVEDSFEHRSGQSLLDDLSPGSSDHWEKPDSQIVDRRKSLTGRDMDAAISDEQDILDKRLRDLGYLD